MQLPSFPGNGGQRSLLIGQLLLLLLVIELAAAVPASVLAQNTELSTNANNKQQQQHEHQLQLQQKQQQRELPATAGECQSSIFGVRGLQLGSRVCACVCVCGCLRQANVKGHLKISCLKNGQNPTTRGVVRELGVGTVKPVGGYGWLTLSRRSSTELTKKEYIM